MMGKPQKDRQPDPAQTSRGRGTVRRSTTCSATWFGAIEALSLTKGRFCCKRFSRNRMVRPRIMDHGLDDRQLSLGENGWPCATHCLPSVPWLPTSFLSSSSGITSNDKATILSPTCARLLWLLLGFITMDPVITGLRY